MTFVTISRLNTAVDFVTAYIVSNDPFIVKNKW